MNGREELNLLPNQTDALVQTILLCQKTSIFETGEEMDDFAEYLKMSTGETLLRVGDLVDQKITTYQFRHNEMGKVTWSVYNHLQWVISSETYHI